AARGYSLALAFLMLAIWQMLRYDESPRRFEWAALFLAGSVASNLTFAFPAVPLAIVFALVLVTEHRRDEAIDRFLLPGLVVAFSIMILPLTHASRDAFFAGSPSLGDGMDSVLGMFLFHDAVGPVGYLFLITILRVARWLIPIVLVTAVAACARRKSFRERTQAGRLLMLATGSLA